MLFVILSLFMAINASAQETEPARNQCCFTNPAYAGVCAVTPVEDETCASILEYLNSPGSVGKTYCNNTRVRGGWQEVDCEPLSN